MRRESNRSASSWQQNPGDPDRIPAHCPYPAGTWVRCHGYAGNMPGGRRWGWRGFVTGYAGGTILVGITDDGLDWAEEWGSLTPDRPKPNREPSYCVCCPRNRPKKSPADGRCPAVRRAPVVDPQQPALFERPLDC